MRLCAGTDLLPLWYWALGADMGRDVVLGDIDVIEEPQLVVVGDRAVVSDMARLQTAFPRASSYWSPKHETVLGADAVVGTGAVLQTGTKLGNGAIVMPQSALNPGSFASSTVISGVPAQETIECHDLHSDCKAKAPALSCGNILGTVTVKVVQSFMLPLLSCFLNLLLVVVVGYFPTLFLCWIMAENGGGYTPQAARMVVPLCFLGFTFLLVLAVAAHKWMIRWKVSPGSFMALRGFTYHIRLHTMIQQTQAALSNVGTLRGSVWAPWYLRLLGAHVDPSAYMDTVMVSDPDLLHVDKLAVVEDATITPGDLEGSQLHLGPIRIGRGAYVGVGSTMLRDTAVEYGGELGAGAFLPSSHRVKCGEVRYGASLLPSQSGQ